MSYNIHARHCVISCGSFALIIQNYFVASLVNCRISPRALRELSHQVDMQRPRVHHPGCRLYVAAYDKERKRKPRDRDRGLTKGAEETGRGRTRRQRSWKARKVLRRSFSPQPVGRVFVALSDIRYPLVYPRISHTTSGSVQQTKTSPSTSDERATLARLVCETKFYITLSFAKETYIGSAKIARRNRIRGDI